MAELNSRINELYTGIMTNENMLAYNNAKQDIKGLIDYINAILNAAIDGDDPMVVEEPAAGCSPDACASCG